jgi:hypothetical protein
MSDAVAGPLLADGSMDRQPALSTAAQLAARVDFASGADTTERLPHTG